MSHDETAGRVALVTGATSGIGRAAALRLAADGFTVLVHGRDERRGAETVARIEAAGGTARFLAADLDDADAVRALAAAAGDVDVLVNNGGFSWFGPTADLDVAAEGADPPGRAKPGRSGTSGPRGVRRCSAWPNRPVRCRRTSAPWPRACGGRFPTGCAP